MHPTIAKIQSKLLKKVPEVKTGYTVRVSQKVKEGGKERIQHFEGLVIKVSHGTGPEKTFTVRKIVEGIGVEKIFPFHSPNVTKVHVVKKAKVRREKLYYMRRRFGKSARLSEKHVTDEERAAEEARLDALYAEASAQEAKVSAEASASEQVEDSENDDNHNESNETDAVEAKIDVTDSKKPDQAKVDENSADKAAAASAPAEEKKDFETDEAK